MPIPIYQVDAFADRPFTGNPAAVVVLDTPCDERWMQSVAGEMNLAETAFVLHEASTSLPDRPGASTSLPDRPGASTSPPDRPGASTSLPGRPGGDGWRLRWFTPAVEVDLCGHATLATAHTLWETGRLPHGETARFFTRSGTLTATQLGDTIELDFPLVPAEPVAAPSGIAEALGTQPRRLAKAGPNLLALFDSEAEIRELQPDFRALRGVDCQGVIVTAQAAGPDYDFVSRYFAPVAGIDEDPVTGSAHCALAPFWSERLGRDELVGYQASARGGYVHVRIAGDRVRLGGTAVTVLVGEFRTENREQRTENKEQGCAIH